MTKETLLKQFKTGALVCMVVAAGVKLGDLSWNGYDGHCGLKDMKMPKWHNGGNAADDPSHSYTIFMHAAEETIQPIESALGIDPIYPTDTAKKTQAPSFER